MRAFAAVLVALCAVAAPVSAGAWEGDDGGLDEFETRLGVWVDRTNRAVWRAEEARQIDEFEAAVAYTIAVRASEQQQLATPPAPPVGGSVWDALAECESGGNWSIDTGNGYYGGLQFALSSWRAVGGQGYPHHASRSEQIHRAEILLDLQGWGAWPACSRRLGLR